VPTSPSAVLDITAFARELADAERTRTQIAPLSARAALTAADAYAIQLANVNRRIAAGERVVGKKVGLTAKPIQIALGVDQPDFGHLFASMQLADGAECPVDALIQPRAEAEIGLILKRDLRGPGLTDLDVVDAAECLVPTLEIVDSRITDWKITFVDTVADNGSAARFVVGSQRTPPAGIDTRTVGVVFEKNGDLVGTGAGAAVLGASPYRAVAWLANTLADAGLELKAGDVIMPGALCAMVPLGRGDTVRADFGVLGSVSVRFV
jgi:2-oxopent-4-enoate hydratase